jgi:Ribosomal protein L44
MYCLPHFGARRARCEKTHLKNNSVGSCDCWWRKSKGGRFHNDRAAFSFSFFVVSVTMGRTSLSNLVLMMQLTYPKPVGPTARAKTAESTLCTKSRSTRPAKPVFTPRYRNLNFLVILTWLQGKRRYDRKQSGYGGQTKPVFHKKVCNLLDTSGVLTGLGQNHQEGCLAFGVQRVQVQSPVAVEALQAFRVGW